MEKTTGVVTSVSQKEGKYGFAIGSGNWYNGFGKCPCNKGDKIEVSYELNNNFKNVQEVKVLEKTEIKPSSMDENAKRRRATDCILAANECFIQGKIEKDNIADHAKGLYNLIEELK